MKLPIHDLIINVSNKYIRKIKKKNLTFLSQRALLNIKNNVQRIEKNSIEGIIVETGCALGGSTILIGLTKSKLRKFNVYDVFGMIPPPSDKDGEDIHERYDKIVSGESNGIKNNLYYGYESNLIKKVENNLNDFNLDLSKDTINLIQGLYEDTLKISEKIALAHIDCDWYDSVLVSLNEIEPNLSVGGIMIIDDYFAWSGCKKAIDFYFKDPNFKSKFDFEFKHKKLNILKKE